MHVGHGQGGPGHPVRRRSIILARMPQNSATRKGANVQRERRSPGGVSPSAALRGSERIREPRQRQAPDGGKEGGSQPTESSRINRRVLLAPALPMHEGKKRHEDLK